MPIQFDILKGKVPVICTHPHAVGKFPVPYHVASFSYATEVAEDLF